MAIGTALTLLIAGGASLFMAWSIGAGSSGSTPFAPAVGANAISVLRAGFVVGLLGLAGATLQGANVSEAVGRELTTGVAISPAAATIGLLVAGTLVAVGVGIGYPIATAFTVTGAMIGVGLAVGAGPAWAKYVEIGALWVATPFVGGGAAYGIARLLRSERTAERRLVPLLGAFVGLVLANVGFALLGPDGTAASVAVAGGRAIADLAGVPADVAGVGISVAVAATLAGLLYWDASRDAAAAQRRFLLGLGGLVAFSAGGSQVGLAIGPLLPVLGELQLGLSTTLVLFGGGLGLLIGSWTGAPRMIKALAQDYSSLGPRRSIAALIPSFVIAQAAVHFGIPVSFNEIIVSAIVGSGYAAGSGGVSRGKMGRTVLAWVVSFGLAFGLSFAALEALQLVT
ncbi:MAG: inorganic phosphate transporter [Halobacteriales archaeon]|nr:inorganic phosphate transporter [Halobacteriales archaeon]